MILKKCVAEVPKPVQAKTDHVSHAKKANITSAIRTLTWKMETYFISRY